MTRADGLVMMAESVLAHGAEAMTGGDKHQIVIHVDAETLQQGHDGRCEIEEGPSIAAETARRLACDASVVTLTENDQGHPLNVSRKTRSIPPALRRALNAPDKGCRFPGCTNTRFVDAHHIHHWADGGETRQSTLVSLCRFHHRLVHEGGIGIERLDDGAIRFVKPDGKAFDSQISGRTSAWSQLPASNVQNSIRIDRNTANTLCQGERTDNGLSIDVRMDTWT